MFINQTYTQRIRRSNALETTSHELWLMLLLLSFSNFNLLFVEEKKTLSTDDKSEEVYFGNEWTYVNNRQRN